jgi:hypothetical protein
MSIGVLLPLILIALIIGFVMWVRRSRTAPASDQVKDPGRARPSGRISLLTEAIGYIGAILVLAGGGVAIGQQWDEFGTTTRLAILGTATVAFLLIGAFTRSSTEPSFKRLTAVTWAISVGMFAGTVAVGMNQYYDVSEETAALTTATCSTAYAIVLWLLNRHAIQHAVMFGGVLVSAAAILTWAIEEPPLWVIPTVLWAIAVAWVSLGWTRRIPPWWMAVPLGLLVALVAPAAIDNDPARYALGMGTAAVVMGLSVLFKFPPGLALGSVAMLGYTVGVITQYLGDTIGVPAALAITGLLILVLAAVASRLLRYTRKGYPPRAGGTADTESAGRGKAA